MIYEETIDYGPHNAAGEPIGSTIFTPEEADALIAGFDWNATVELPETEADGTPAVFYSIVQITSTADTDLLTESMIPWDTLPMFGPELAAWQSSGVVLPGSGGHGTFVFAFMPGANYNIARQAALAGTPLFRLIVLRRPPVEVHTNPDGSLDLAWMRSQGWCWPTGSCTTAAPLVSDGVGVHPEPLLTDFLRDIGSLFAQTGQNIADGITQFFGSYANEINKTATVAFVPRYLNADADFVPAGDDIRVGWLGGRGTPISAVGTTVIIRQIGALLPTTWSSTIGNANGTGRDIAFFTLPQGHRYQACMRLSNPVAMVTDALLPIEVCVGPFTLPLGTTTATFAATITDPSLQAFLIAGDGVRFFASQQIGVRRPIILVGQLAQVLSPAGNAFTPGLGGRDPTTRLTIGALETTVLGAVALGTAIPGLGITPLAPGDPVAAAAAIGALSAMDVDIILPPTAFPSRIVVAHEFGHHAFYQMMLATAPPPVYVEHLNTIFGATILNAITPGAFDPLDINEAMADLTAAQLVGGVNRLTNGANVYSGDNVGGGEVYCRTTPLPGGAPGCMDTNLLGNEPGATAAAVATSRIETLMHDLVDGPMILSAQHNGVVFASTTTGCIPALAECPLSATALPVAESGDEPIQVPFQVIRAGISHWVADPIEGPVFSLDNFMRGQTRALRETGFSDGLIRGVYGLHTPGLRAPPAWLP